MLTLWDCKASSDVNCVHDAGGDRGDELSHLAAALRQPTRPASPDPREDLESRSLKEVPKKYSAVV